MTKSRLSKRFHIMSTIIRRPTEVSLEDEFTLSIYWISILVRKTFLLQATLPTIYWRGEQGDCEEKKKTRNAFQCNDKDMQLLFMIHFSTTLPHEEIPKGLSTWRREVPSTRKILGRGTTFCSIYMQKFRSVWLTVEKGIKIKDYPLNESPPFCSACL